uniref:hypothetical protein n=1 Tax=Cellvibrio fontiphilus TaxID=1815559 RepID=UPI002B4BCE63|nr:hypothetical protein [Cellvibrio fontiphilus]
MSEVKTPKVLLTQIEDALEERQNNDRRQQHKGVPHNVSEDRRQGDRRSQPAKS